MKFSFLYVTCSKVSEAKSIGRALVEAKVAACVNVLPYMNSIYEWKGKIESAEEVVLIVKTSKALVKKTQEKIVSLHSYDTPCVIEIPLGSVHTKYAQWLEKTLCVTPRSRK